jgi:hypothetical protein
MKNRQAGVGRQLLHQQGFHLARDLRVGPSGCLEWGTDQPKLQAWLPEFFYQRQEDGE